MTVIRERWPGAYVELEGHQTYIGMDNDEEFGYGAFGPDNAHQLAAALLKALEAKKNA